MSRKSTSSLCFLEQAKFQLPVISNEDSNEMKDGDHFQQIKNILVHSNKYSKTFLSINDKNTLCIFSHEKLEDLFDGGNEEQYINTTNNSDAFEKRIYFESEIIKLSLSSSEEFISIVTKKHIFIIHLAAILCEVYN